MSARWPPPFAEFEREVREECCRDECLLCRQGNPVIDHAEHGYIHDLHPEREASEFDGWADCDARYIRRAAALRAGRPATGEQEEG